MIIVFKKNYIDAHNLIFITYQWSWACSSKKYTINHMLQCGWLVSKTQWNLKQGKLKKVGSRLIFSSRNLRSEKGKSYIRGSYLISSPFFSFLKTILDFYRIIISKSIFLQPRQESDKENKRNCMGSKYVFVNWLLRINLRCRSCTRKK